MWMGVVVNVPVCVASPLSHRKQTPTHQHMWTLPLRQGAKPHPQTKHQAKDEKTLGTKVTGGGNDESSA